MEPPSSSYRGYVYLIGSERFGWYKIGKARNASIRIRDIGCLLPFQIRAIGLWKTVDPYGLESAMHQKYKSFRINGEWFHFHPGKIRTILGQDTPLPSVRVSIPEALQFSNMASDLFTSNEERQLGVDNRSAFRQLLADNKMEFTKENKYLARQHIKNLARKRKSGMIPPVEPMF